MLNQTVIYEESELQTLLNDKKIFMVRTPSFERLALNKVFEKHGVFVFDGFKPNPTLEQVEDAINLFNEGNFDMIVVAGGGSALDVAKCVKLFANIESKEYLNKALWKALDIPLLAIPTTAGSGSESTRHAVIYKNGIKQSVSSFDIVPDFVMLWGEALRTLPEYQKKSTMFDALCQSIESWWSNSATSESIEFSKKSIELIKTNWKAYLKNEEKSFEPMLKASFFSGCAINITATTAAHAMSYGLTGKYKIPHGHAVALCMYRIWKSLKLADITERKTEEFLDIIKVLADIEGVITFEEFEKMITETDMLEFKAEKSIDDVKVLVKTVNPERLGNHPQKLDEEKLTKLYAEVLGYED